MRALDESGSASCQFDSAPRQSDPLHAAEQLQQHFNSLARLHAGVQSEVSAERASKDPHPIASTQPRRLLQFNQPTPFAAANFGNESVRHRHRSIPSSEQANHAGAPSCQPPATFDHDEHVARK